MTANPIWIAGYFGPVAGASPVWIAPGDGTVPSAVQSEIVSFSSPVAGATAVWIAAYGGPPPAAIGATPIIISGWGGSGGGVAPPHDWSRVQGVLNAAGGAASTTLTLPAAVTSGNIVVGSLLLISSFVTNITDDKGNAYQIVNADGSQDGVSNLQVTGFCSVAPITNGAKTLTITYPNSAVSWGIVEEFTAGAPLPAISIDGAQLLINSGANSTPNFQTLQSNDLLWSASFDSTNVTAGAGWTAGQGNGGQQMSMWKQGGAPSGSVAALIVQSSSVWTTVFGVAPVARSSWLLRQNQIQRTNGGGVSGSVTFPNTIATGSYVIGTVALGTSAGHVSDIVSIVDDKGNSYSIIPGYIDASGRAMFWSGGPLANGPKTITCTTSVSESLIYFLINEFVPPPGTTSVSIDGTPTMITVPGGSSYTSGSVTTSANGDLLYSEADLVGGGALPTNGFSTLNGQGVTWCDAYFIQKSAGSVAAGWSAGTAGAANTIGLVAFSASSASPPVTSVWSAADASANGMTLTNGGLTVTSPGGNKSIRSTIGMSSGSLYVEFLAVHTGGNEYQGVADSGFSPAGLVGSSGQSGGATWNANLVSGSFIANFNAGAIYPNTGDVVGIAVDFTLGQVWISIRGVWLGGGTPTFTKNLPMFSFVPATAGTLFPALSPTDSGEIWTLQSTAASQKYAPPSGFSAWDSGGSLT